MSESINKMYLKVDAVSENEGFVRTVVAAFMLQLNPSVEELSDVKTAVSEAVTNAVVHAYPDNKGEIEIFCETGEKYIKIIISDNGVGILDTKKAVEPYFTTKPSEERTGLGFTIIRSFMDEFLLESREGAGTKLTMTKKVA